MDLEQQQQTSESDKHHVTVGKRYEQALKEARSSPEYWAEGMCLDVTSAVVAVMMDQKITQAELARRLNVDPAHVSRLLSGSHNMTISSVARLLTAVGLGGSIKTDPVDVIRR